MKTKHINTKVVIAELHRAFKMFNEGLFYGELPEPAILIQSRGNKKLTLGWCTVQKVWKNDATQEEKYEINLVAEGLNRGIYPVMTTLLHEMVHLHNLVNGIKDVSRGNTYHNGKFKKVAEQHGLIVEHDAKIGWSISKLQGFTMDLVDSFHFDETVFSFGRKDLDFEGIGKPRKKKKTSSRKYICPECGTSIRASKDVNILCADCTDIAKGKIVQLFKVVEEDEEGTEELLERICLSCGAVVNVPHDCTVCPECGEDLEGTEEPEVPEEEEMDNEEDEDSDAGEEPADEFPISIIEVDRELEGGTPVVQGAFDLHDKSKNTGWTSERVYDTLKDFTEELKGLNILGITIDISEKLKGQWAIYKEKQNKFVFSANYLEEASDDEIIDTIKHQAIHHYQYTERGLKSNHKKDFKDLCIKYGISTDVPQKNHRPMK